MTGIKSEPLLKSLKANSNATFLLKLVHKNPLILTNFFAIN